MLALIEIRRRKLQFGFVTGVVALIAYLIIMVTGLGLGLREAAGTALLNLNLNGDHLAYAANSNLSVIRSRLSEADVAEVQALQGAARATPIAMSPPSLSTPPTRATPPPSSASSPAPSRNPM